MGTHAETRSGDEAGVDEIDDATGLTVVHAAPENTVTVHRPRFYDVPFNGFTVGTMAELTNSVYAIKGLEDDPSTNANAKRNLPPDTWAKPPGCTLPHGWRVEGVFSGRTKAYLAVLFNHQNTDYVLAFRGTTFDAGGHGWKEDVLQGLGGTGLTYDHSGLAAAGSIVDQYQFAVTTALRVLNQGGYNHSRQTLTFTGHSLGGGLAACAHVLSGCVVPTVTFNAAGLHPNTQAYANSRRGTHSWPSQGICANGTPSGLVLAYNVWEEPVTVLQAYFKNGGDIMINNRSVRVAPVPQAYGKHIEMPLDPSHVTNFLQRPRSFAEYLQGLVETFMLSDQLPTIPTFHMMAAVMESLQLDADVGREW